MIGVITGLFVFLFLFGVPLIILSERWMPLLGAIFRGDSSHLKEDMFESGICEKKREGWIPLEPKPVRFFDNLGLWTSPEWTPPEWTPPKWTPPKRTPPKLTLPKWTPRPVAPPPYREKEPELEQLAQELFAELEE